MDPALDRIDDALLDEIVEALGPATNLSLSQSRALISRILVYGGREDPHREFAYDLAYALFYRHGTNRQLFVQPTDREAGIIGEGSFAEVYRAKLKGEDVALKVMKESFTQAVIVGSLKPFIRELEAWKEIPPHINLLPLLGICIDVDRLQGCVRYVFVSPFAGENLLHLSVSSMPLHTVRDIFLQVARGLDFLHNRLQPIIHGDIRASNILFKDGRAVLADFGLAKVLEAHSSSFTLSPLRSKMRYHWLAPELINDETRSRTTATDVFAFACTVIEAFTKQPPSIYPLQSDRRPPRALAGQHWKPLWDLLQDCLHEDPSQRPTASQLVTRIEPLFPHTDDLAKKFLQAHSGND
jgi:serine/threonine protein kinase